MGRKKITFVIDTGAESNVINSRLPDQIFENITITRHVSLFGSGNKKIEALYGYVKNIQIGGLPMNTLPVLVTNLEKMCNSYNKCIHGCLVLIFFQCKKLGLIS